LFDFDHHGDSGVDEGKEADDADGAELDLADAIDDLSDPVVKASGTGIVWISGCICGKVGG